MHNMTFYDTSASRYEGITAWFWVNSSEDWTIEVSPDTIEYDANQSVTVTVKDSSGALVTGNVWVDIWLLDDTDKIDDVSGSNYIILHTLISTGYLNISNMYTYTHTYGAGVYQFFAYADYRGSTNRYADYVYGTNNQGYGDYVGYNQTFGNVSYWTEGINCNFDYILDSDGSVVNQAATYWSNTTYRYQTCGAFDPPEKISDYFNLTVSPGTPQFTVKNGTQFWNDTWDNEINITLFDSDGNKIDYNGDITPATDQFRLYNKSNNPANRNSKPIPDITKYVNFNLTSTANYYIVKISPRNVPGGNNRWGYNDTNNFLWAARGNLWFCWFTDSKGNTSREWNGTYKLSLAQASAQIKWIDDDGPDSRLGWASTNSDTDGILPSIPSIHNVPVLIKFKIINTA